jgi:aryl-alcohol dehydrogenase-like predicted oxidoreductase
MTNWLPAAPAAPSRIVLGSVFFGTDISREDSFAVMDAYAEGGGNFIDTANGYALWLPGGVGSSELTIGAWLHERRLRDRMIIATKGGHPRGDSGEFGDLSRAEIEKDLGQSLERLGVGYVDLYWLHRDQPTRPVSEIVEMLADIRNSGRIRAYGVSNWELDRIEAANACAEARGLPLLAAHQPPFSLAHVAGGPGADARVAESEDAVRAWHVRSQLPLVAYTSQASGYFGAENVSWARDGFSGDPTRGSSFDSPANRRRLLQAIELAEQKGCTANQIALAYLLSQPFPVHPIIGTGNPDHAREALGAVKIVLTAEERSFLLT